MCDRDTFGSSRAGERMKQFVSGNRPRWRPTWKRTTIRSHGGETYLFCCPPCVDEFLTTAKENSGAVGLPSAYIQP